RASVAPAGGHAADRRTTRRIESARDRRVRSRWPLTSLLRSLRRSRCLHLRSSRAARQRREHARRCYTPAYLFRPTCDGPRMVRAMATQPGIAQRLVGRQAELEVIQAHVDAALGGGGQVLVVGDDAGVETSRLLAGFARRFTAAAPDGLVLTGNWTGIW